MVHRATACSGSELMDMHTWSSYGHGRWLMRPRPRRRFFPPPIISRRATRSRTANRDVLRGWGELRENHESKTKRLLTHARPPPPVTSASGVTTRMRSRLWFDGARHSHRSRQHSPPPTCSWIMSRSPSRRVVRPGSMNHKPTKHTHTHVRAHARVEFWRAFVCDKPSWYQGTQRTVSQSAFLVSRTRSLLRLLARLPKAGTAPAFFAPLSRTRKLRKPFLVSWASQMALIAIMSPYVVNPIAVYRPSGP